MAEPDLELVRQGFDALAAGGIEALIPLIHPEFEVTTPASLAAEPDTYRGPDGVSTTAWPTGCGFTRTRQRPAPQSKAS